MPTTKNLREIEAKLSLWIIAIRECMDRDMPLSGPGLEEVLVEARAAIEATIKDIGRVH